MEKLPKDLQLFAEHGYSAELDMDKLKRRFKFCTEADYEAFYSLSRLDNIAGLEGDTSSNPSKYILWQDILCGLFDKNLEGHNLTGYYAGLKDLLNGYAQNSGQWGLISIHTPGSVCSASDVTGGKGAQGGVQGTVASCI